MDRFRMQEQYLIELEKSKYYLEKSSKYMKEEREYERLRQKYINHKILAKYYHSIIVNSPS
jgi:hypothetical protein